MYIILFDFSFCYDIYTHMNTVHVFNWQRETELTNPEFVDEKIRSIEADHPIVSVVGNFAVTAFNKACNKVWCLQQCLQLWFSFNLY